MPKNTKWGENSHAVEARERRSAAEQERLASKQKAEEEAMWRDDDKLVNRKLQRKEDEEHRVLEAQQKKKEKEDLLRQEEMALASASGKAKQQKKKGSDPNKLTQFQILQNMQNQYAGKKQKKAEKEKELAHANPASTEQATTIPENINIVQSDFETARNVDTAVKLLSTTSVSQPDDVDRHPEKRMKAAFAAYEERELPILRQENPSLRRTTLKDMLWKQWQKSPENPMNQAKAT